MERESEVPAREAKRPNEGHTRGNFLFLVFDCDLMEIWMAIAVRSYFKSGTGEFQYLIGCQVRLGLT